ncbi:porin family protein [Flavivirga rizhaonensis]|uniref:PorT family protein n=1 Tax=Flavivirga rizhaonensis TaxID=2559571 RepID=A0A4S1E1G7_9FLAO|nr:outer membrane beta-barrel protein [Flavivirga rizhaonensis]TGV03778.1 PorT family protein [Flavivirga rizhaonensis]
MSDKKHIDRLFQEGFKDFEAIPSDAVWEHIEAKLNQKKKKRRVIPIWWRYAGVAALLLLLLTIGGVYFNDSDKTQADQIVDTKDTPPLDSKKDNSIDLNDANDAIVNTDSNENKSSNSNNTPQQTNFSPKGIITSEESSIVETPASRNGNEEKKEANVITNKEEHAINKLLNAERNNAVANNSREKNNTNKIANKPKSHVTLADNSEENKNTDKLQKALKSNTVIASGSEKNNQGFQQDKELLIGKKRAKEIVNNASKSNNAIAKTEENNTEIVTSEEEKSSLTIEEAIDKTKDIIEEDDNVNRWSISPNAAPVYFNTLSKGSSIDPQFNDNSKSGELNMSYGISASYAINEKLSIRSGINKVNLGYSTNDIVSFQVVGVSSSSRSLQNVNAIKTENVSSDAPTDNTVSLFSEESLNSSDIPEAFPTSNSSINQNLGYIEIPLEIQYALSDKKLGVNLIGGFSSFFLSNNKIFSESQEGGRTLLGKANNINKVSYSANLGLGLNYKVSKKIDLNLEPMFKYQINTFNNTSGDFKPFFIGVYTGFAIKF